MKLLDQWLESQKGVALFGKVNCPRNFVLKPGCHQYKMIENPRLRGMTQYDEHRLNETYKMKIKRWIYARNHKGEKILNPNSFYMPDVSKAYVVEHIYDPLNPVCKMKCRGKCLRGVGGNTNLLTIKRLKSSPNPETFVGE